MTLGPGPQYPFQLPPNHILKTLEHYNLQYIAPVLKQATEPLHRAEQDLFKFADQHMDTTFRAVPFPTNDRTSRINLLLKDLFYSQTPPPPALQRVIAHPILAQNIAQLKQNFAVAEQYRTQQAQGLRPLGRYLSDFLRVNKHAWAQAVDALRMSPTDPQLTIPHPHNIRVLASSSQLGGSYGSRRFEVLPWSDVQLLNGVVSQPTLDDAIHYAEQQVLVVDGEDVEGKFGDKSPNPHIEKPISTPRQNKAAWRKADNTNPWVKRIVILVPTEDGSSDGQHMANIYPSYFKPAPIQAFQANPNLAPFRVDQIITVAPPTPEEALIGMTINDKIHQAFQQAQQFVLQNKQQARQWALQHGLDPNQAEQALQFEGFSSWAGHGEALPSIGPGKYDDRKFREGSREYSFWSNPNRQQIGGLDETTIKQWEYQYLKDFRYFVQQFTTCASGAMIA